MAYVLQGSPLLPYAPFQQSFAIRQHSFANTQLRFGDKIFAPSSSARSVTSDPLPVKEEPSQRALDANALIFRGNPVRPPRHFNIQRQHIGIEFLNQVSATSGSGAVATISMSLWLLMFLS